MGLQYIFNVVILFMTVVYFKHFKLKIDQKMSTFKNLEEVSQKHLATLIN